MATILSSADDQAFLWSQTILLAALSQKGILDSCARSCLVSPVTLLDPAVFQFVCVMGKDAVNKVGIKWAL